MVFSSISFLYYFLPTVIGLYFIVPFKLKNTVLLVVSMLFYFYGEPVYSIVMIVSSLAGYLHGLWIHRARGGRYAKLPMITSTIIIVSFLVFFKYTDFFIVNFNWIFHTKIPPLNLELPIGISFYSFQILSYTLDVYRKEAKVQKNYFKLTTYVTLFPQLIAGPIVRYTTIEEELSERTHGFAHIAYGIHRFIIGLSKKVILANTLGELGNIFANTQDKTLLFYWMNAIAFTLQIYYDFSGYSDMAIGLGRIFGFHFLENFYYPFISKSISEFWRRWHISLGTWFRDYVYIPMGGNRVSTVKWFRNVLVVWFLTGFWHGAEWNFIIWGLYFALFLILEKYIMKKVLEKLPSVIRHLYTLFFITVSFAIFNSESLFGMINNLKGMFGALNLPLSNADTLYYLRSYSFVLLIATIGATPFMAVVLNRLKKYNLGQSILNMLEPVLHVILLLLNTAYLVDGSFNPFLYFRF